MSNVIRLGDYITEISEKTTVNNQHMVLTSSQEGIVSQDDYFNKQVASKDNTGYKIIRRGQFTYRAMSDTGRFYINRLTDYDIGIVSPAYPVFELRTNGQILPEYLQEYFHSEHFQNAITLSSTGSTRVSLKLAKIADLRIDIPTLPKQQCAVQAISHVNHLISMQNSSAAKLDQLVKSRFVEMFGDCVINQKHWKTRFLEDIAEVGSSKRVFVEELQETGIPFYRGTEVGALAEGKPIDPELFITEEHYNKLCEATGKPQIGDLLMPSICPDGRIWVVNTDKPFYFKDGRVLWVHSVISGYNPVFLLYTLKDRIMSDYNSIASGTTFAELKIFALKKCRVFEVPLELQNRFAAFVAEVDKSKLAVKQSLEKLETLKKSLMQEYFG